MAVAWFPDPDRVEKMLTPGAVMSGLSQLSPLRGPPDVKLAKLEKPGFVIVTLVNVTVPAGPGGVFVSAPASLLESDVAVVITPRIPKNGIVTVY
jgi:hypothetical protein